MKTELDKVKGFAKLWPMIRPKYALFIGILLLGISQINSIVTGLMMGRFMAVLSTPLEDDVMQKFYPDSGYKLATEICKYEISLNVTILAIVGVVAYFFGSSGKRCFGILSYNITYDIR